MTAARAQLPNRRFSETFTVEAAGLRFTATISRYENGRLGEIFLTNHRAGSGAGIMANDCAIAASLALQFGCPADILRKAVSRDAQGRAIGPLGIALDIIAGEIRR
jgi:ribonucleoside-diphosphate reductase alpha chain